MIVLVAAALLVYLGFALIIFAIGMATMIGICLIAALQRILTHERDEVATSGTL